MRQPLRAVLFDMDDTLIDWSGVSMTWREIDMLYIPGVIDWLRSAGHADGIDPNALSQAFSFRHRRAWQNLGPSLESPNMPLILMQSLAALGVDCSCLDEGDLIAAYAWQGAPGCCVFPDVAPALDTLRAAGIKLGLVTNASQPMSMRDAELRKFGLLDYFPHCRVAAVEAGALKPHPRIFELALEKIDAEPGETVFVGDSLKADIAGALGLGMRAIWRDNDNPGSEICGSQARLHSFADLPAILDQWHPGWRDDAD